MFSFKSYTLLTEKTSHPEHQTSADTKGKLHELLTGYHLNGGKHMSKHVDTSGDSPKEAHDKLKATVHPHEYKEINDKAKAAAAHIKKHYVKGKIHAVHWTSKPGDIHRSTNIHSSQKEDPSDIVVTTTHYRKPKHLGVSLKTTDKPGRHVPVSNPGMESLHGGHEIVKKHREELIKHHPALANSNKSSRTQYVKEHPHHAEDIKKRNSEMIDKVTDHLHNHLSKASHQDLVHHLRHHVMHAKETPMQQLGHQHVRHTTHGKQLENGKMKYKFTHIDPSKHHEHILRDPHNITVHKGKGNIVFKHKGKTFAEHRIKLSSSDPLSHVQGSGSVHS